MIVNAWITGTAVEFSEDGSDAYTETHGWVDKSWSCCELFDSRNDVKPVATWNSDDECDTDDYPTVNAFIKATLNDQLGAWEDGGNGHYYSTDEHMCSQSLEDGKARSFAVHFTYKRYDSARGWIEDAVTLAE